MNSVQPQNLQNTTGIYPNPNQQNINAVQSPAQNPVYAPTPVQQNICYPPQYYYGMPTYAMPNYPRSSVGAVEININNPSVNNGPTYIPQASYCIPIPAQQPAVQSPQQPAVQAPQQPAPPPAAAPIPVEKPVAEEPKKTEAKKEEPKKEIVQLTDEYIKTLENYLNNPNADVRLLGAKEILNRFKEDKTRRNDQALTNLLNKALRDPAQNVRLMALTALDIDVVEGDKLTFKVLQDMQKSDAVYNQDSVLASGIMLKKAGKKLSVESKENSAPLKEAQPQTGKNLDVTAG